MKRISFLIAICLAGAMSAQTPNEYDRWASDNIGYYSTAPRSEIVVLPFFQQQALYNLFSPEKKVAVWEYKAEDIRNSENLTAAEKKTLLKFLRKYAKTRYLDIKSDRKYHIRFRKAGDELESVLRQRYNWDERKIFRYLECWLTDAEYEAYCAKYDVKG